MKLHKINFFRRLIGFAAVTLFIFFLSNTSFAQSEAIAAKLFFNYLVSVSGTGKIDDNSIFARPRLANEKIIVLNEAAKNNFEANAALNSMALAQSLERRAFELLNRRRIENGLPKLTWSDDMARVARGHSQEMAQFRFFSHAGRNGSMVDSRADKLGFKKWKAIGENIAYNRGYENPADFACERWMQSTSHRGNILNERWKEAGIGVAITLDGTYYFTEVFVIK